MEPAKTDGSHQEPHEPDHAPPEHPHDIVISSQGIEAAESPHPSRGVASDDVRVVTGEVERVHKEDGYQEDAHEEVWHGGGGEGGVEGEEGGMGGRERAAVSLHR